jgi:site-specific recombinase XerD
MTDEAMSPLRRRMIEDMTIRKLSPKTQQGYIRTIKNLATFLGRSPDKASFEDIRRFQLHLATSGVSTPMRNQAVAALRFFTGSRSSDPPSSITRRSSMSLASCRWC